VLVVDFGSYYFLLDGHHRFEAAKRVADENGDLLSQTEIDAYVLDGEEVNQIVEDKFYGDFPTRHEDLVDAMGLDYEF
jgi:ParB-like chromosome segregation protein Spo0J